jgi:hypothetical protein
MGCGRPCLCAKWGRERAEANVWTRLDDTFNAMQFCMCVIFGLFSMPSLRAKRSNPQIALPETDLAWTRRPSHAALSREIVGWIASLRSQ